MKQRSAEWYNIRRGKFTASSIYKLMGVKGLGKTGETYIIERVTEMLGAEIPIFQNAAMSYGTEMESTAKIYYEAAIGCEIKDVGFLIPEWNVSCGASPDGFIVGKNKGIEIKCPYNPTEHTKNLLIKSQEQFKIEHTEYYWQIQMCMAVSDFETWDFISFNPQFAGINRMLVMEIKRDESDIDLLKKRINEAVSIRDELISKINI